MVMIAGSVSPVSFSVNMYGIGEGSPVNPASGVNVTIPVEEL